MGEPTLAEILEAIGFLWKLWLFNLGLHVVMMFLSGIAVASGVAVVWKLTTRKPHKRAIQEVYHRE